jgi:hypothetical protein
MIRRLIARLRRRWKPTPAETWLDFQVRDLYERLRDGDSI